jgi:acid phosphatase (class A)
MRRSSMWRTLIALSACVAITASVQAQSKKGPRILAADAVNVVELLPDPPSPGSAEQQAELQTVLAVQTIRTPQDVARANAEVNLDVFAFADVLGPNFSSAKCPQTAALFKDLEADAKFFAREGKNHWMRRRPPFLDSRIHPTVSMEDEGSYPSSHSTRSTLYAMVLARVFPNHRSALLERGRQIGWDRVVGGVHYPSDVDAGRMLGQALAVKLLAKPEFREELSGVADELHRVLPADAQAAAALAP